MKIPIKKYEYEPYKTIEENFQKLKVHHEEETKFLIAHIQELEEVFKLQIEELQRRREINDKIIKANFTFEAAIKKHREQTGNNMCWENDEELWAALNDDVKIDHTPPDWCEFMTKCVEYRASKDKK